MEPRVAIGDTDRIGRADLVDTRLAIVAEAESWEHHGLREAFDHDIQRYTAMVRAGLLVVRFVYGDVMHRPAYIRDVLADLVRLRG